MVSLKGRYKRRPRRRSWRQRRQRLPIFYFFFKPLQFILRFLTCILHYRCICRFKFWIRYGWSLLACIDLCSSMEILP
ncbi:hypothetical protein V6Z12_A02G207600 [Gossypium hirsutum]